MTLKLAVAQLRLRFSDTGEIDFIEIAQRAASALGHADDPGELLLKLDASIRHLLIDEFQDTSQTQLDLLNTLTSGWQEGDGRSLFLVGDPMQSSTASARPRCACSCRLRKRAWACCNRNF